MDKAEGAGKGKAEWDVRRGQCRRGRSWGWLHY